LRFEAIKPRVGRQRGASICGRGLERVTTRMRSLKFLLGPERTYPNMFDAHPPFQIDGNFGGASGISEMLVQCDDGEIRLLPALPRAWPAGRVTGLRARGGFEIDLSWKNASVEKVSVHSLLGRPLRLRRGEAVRSLSSTQRGMTLVFAGNDLRPE
jgi:alpha-L-fucosidase 2